MNTAAEAKSVREPAFRKPNQTRAARRRRELVDGLERDLERSPNTTERALILQAADAILTREAIRVAAARGEPIDAGRELKISGVIVRTLSALHKIRSKRGRPGGKPRGRPTGPLMLDSILAAKRGAV